MNHNPSLINTIILDLEGVVGYYLNPDLFECYDGVENTIQVLVAKYDIYYLSNVMACSSRYFDETLVPILMKLGFVGGMGSNRFSYAKPDPRFYKALFSRYKITLANALFVDDQKRNVVAARQLGILSQLHTTKGTGLLENIQALIQDHTQNQ